MRNMPRAGVLIALGLSSLIFSSVQAADVHVADYGAIPDDGQSDLAAIRAAITAAANGLPRICRFDAGVYNLAESEAIDGALITIADINALSLIGATDADGEPATVLQRNVAELANQMDLANVIKLDGGGNLTLKNLVVDNQPQFASAGVCVRVDETNDVVEVDVFEGLPHFDGMQAFSANAWDLATRDLLGGVPHLTIGTDASQFTHQWRYVSGGAGRRYQLEGMGLAEKLNVGDGVSWHFNVIDAGHMLSAHDTNGLTLENLRFPNAPVAVGSLRNVKDLTCRRVVLAPNGNQLAVGPRDGFFINQSYGEYRFEDCYFKGVRWDPISLFNKFVFIEHMLDTKTAEVFWYGSGNLPFDNLQATLWFAGGPATATIQANTWGQSDTDELGETIRHGTVTFADDVPAGFGAGDSFAPHRRTLTEFRNTTFEGNYGRSPYLSGINMVIENCTFRNNGYAFALGPSSLAAGAFCRNVVIRGNTFSDSVWSITSQGPTSGAIRLYQNNPQHFTNEPFHDNILIENNTFQGINFDPQFAAIDVQNAQNVTIRCNTYINTPNTVQIESASTQSITIVDDGLPGGCPTCAGTTVVADFNDMLLGAMRVNDGQVSDTGDGFAEDYWSAGTAQIQVVPGDLSAPSSTGYSVYQLPPAQRVQGVFSSDDRRQARQTVPVSGALGEDIWISFLVQNNEVTDVAGIDLMETNSINPNPPTTVRKIILEGTTLKIVASGDGGGEVDLSNKYALGQTALVLAKLTAHGLSDPEQIEVWIDPNVTNGVAGLPAPDFTQSSDLEWDMDSITWLGLQSWDTGASGIGGYIDSIRISNGVCGFEFVVESALPGDCDGDKDLDWTDYVKFEGCLAGPDMAPDDCACADINRDAAVDLKDLDLLQRLFTGAL